MGGSNPMLDVASGGLYSAAQGNDPTGLSGINANLMGSPSSGRSGQGQQQIPQYGSNNIFQAHQQYMPSEYNSNSPIYNPANILNAYMQNMPSFLQVAKQFGGSMPSTTRR